MDLRAIFNLFRDTFKDWSEDKAARLGAALAYYTIFSVGPLLLIAIAIAGLVFGQQRAQDQIVGTIRTMVGGNGAEVIIQAIQNASKPGASIVASAIGIVTLLFGASGVFGQLKDALNTIWEVKPKPGLGVMAMVRDRFLSFTMVLGTGFLLLVSLVISAALAALGSLLSKNLPGGDVLWQIVNLVLAILVVTLVFAMIFKFLPDVQIAWRDVAIGALITSLLFNLGQIALGVYLGSGSVGSAYGAAGSLVIVLVWIYYSAQILFFGAEFTQVYARTYGTQVKPTPNAEFITEESRAQQGITRDEGGKHARARERRAQQGSEAGRLVSPWFK